METLARAVSSRNWIAHSRAGRALLEEQKYIIAYIKFKDLPYIPSLCEDSRHNKWVSSADRSKK